MKQFLTYECKVCGQGGMVEFDCAEGHNFEFANAAMCHTRCADFVNAKTREFRRIDAILTLLARRGVEDENARSTARAALVKSTKVFCRIVTNYHRKPPSWQPELADSILKNPTKWFSTLNYFEKAQAKV